MMSKKRGPARRWTWLKRIGLTLASVLALLVGVLLLLEWRPAAIEDTAIHAGQASRALAPTERLELLTWNLGYAGLDASADFFMDGGRQVRPGSQTQVEANLSALLATLSADPADVILLQEIDSKASRTFGQDQTRRVADALPEYFWARALNFKVRWIPIPLTEPMGRVESGLVSLSRQRPKSARRLQLPGGYSWPVRAFHLKRCVHELRLEAADGKDWVILHLHLSAFDKGGVLRRQEMAFLKQHMMALYAEGHHVIAGGDWNQAFPGLSPDRFRTTADLPDWFQQVPDDWTPAGWRWAFDARRPSLRATNQPWDAATTFQTSVDGFLLSPDLSLCQPAETTDLGFAHSDHHPVRIAVCLNTATD